MAHEKIYDGSHSLVLLKLSMFYKMNL